MHYNHRSFIIILIMFSFLPLTAAASCLYSNDSTLIKMMPVKGLAALSDKQKTAVERINHCQRSCWHNWSKKLFAVPINDSVAAIFSPLKIYRQEFKDQDSIILVDIQRQFFGCYRKGYLSYWGPISSGRRGKSTPIGSWKVNGKFRLIHSAKYNNAPMPYCLRFNGNYCLHQGLLPGCAASHGCVRLLRTDAIWLYAHTSLGVRVIIE